MQNETYCGLPAHFSAKTAGRFQALNAIKQRAEHQQGLNV